jgi:hypothetical protein
MHGLSHILANICDVLENAVHHVMCGALCVESLRDFRSACTPTSAVLRSSCPRVSCQKKAAPGMSSDPATPWCPAQWCFRQWSTNVVRHCGTVLFGCFILVCCCDDHRSLVELPWLAVPLQSRLLLPTAATCCCYLLLLPTRCVTLTSFC